MKARHAGKPLEVTGCSLVWVSIDTIEALGPLTAAQAVYQATLAQFGFPIGNFDYTKLAGAA